MVESNEHVKKKRAAPGTGFPVISLPAAAKIIREAGAYGKQHTSSALATYAGHKTANSGAWLAKVAALKDWGLVTTVPPDSFALTERAMLIAHPTSSDAGQKALLEAFNNCKLYVGLYEDMAKGRELKSAFIANKAVTEKGVAVASKEAFARSFVESTIAVGLAEQVNADAIKLLVLDLETSDPEDVAPEDEDAAVEAPAKRPDGDARKVAKPAGTPIIHQTWALADGGEISFSVSSNKALTASVFTDLGKVIESIEGLADKVGLPSKVKGDDDGQVPEK